MHIDFSINLSRDDRGIWHATIYQEHEDGKGLTIISSEDGSTANRVALLVAHDAQDLADHIDEMEARLDQEAFAGTPPQAWVSSYNYDRR